MFDFRNFLITQIEEVKQDTYAIAVCPAFFVFFGLYLFAVVAIGLGGANLPLLLCLVLALSLVLILVTSRLHYKNEFAVACVILVILFCGMTREANYIGGCFSSKNDTQTLKREIVTLRSKQKWGRAEALVFQRIITHVPQKFVYFNWEMDGDTEFIIGAAYTVSGICHPFRQGRKNRAKNFDQWKFWQGKGVSSTFAKFGKITETSPPTGIFALRQFFEEKINSLLLPKSQGYMKIFLLGQRSLGVEKLYKGIGVIHIMAISGLHLGLLLAFLCLVTRDKFLRFFCGTFFLWGFIYMVGCPVSALRAGIMAQAFLLSLVFDLPGTALNSLCLAGSLIILSNPFCVVDLGFTLSFVCVFFLSSLPNDFSLSCASFCLTDALIWIVTAPILAHYFGRVSISAVISNIFILPAFGMVFPLAILLCLASFAMPCFSFLSQVLEVLLASFEAFSSIFAKLPALYVCESNLLLMVASFIFFATLFYKLTENKAKSALLATIFSIAVLIFWR